VLSDPGLREALSRFLSARLPAAEVDDAVQETLVDALGAAQAPESPEQIRGWVHGIARHKVADYYRSRQRVNRAHADDDPPSPESAPLSARELLRWAERQTDRDPVQQATLEWMLREGDGDRLEEIARETDLPAARVRQRVSRLRRALQSRWTAELTAAAGLVALVLLAAWWWSRPNAPSIVREPIPAPSRAPAPAPARPARDSQPAKSSELSPPPAPSSMPSAAPSSTEVAPPAPRLNKLKKKVAPSKPSSELSGTTPDPSAFDGKFDSGK
jgi:RNA polymerase sigma factor (sigma-70 family)